MHPMEFRRQKCSTGRLACLNLANSEIIPGVSFEGIARFRSLIDDPGNHAVLLYPGEGAMTVGDGRLAASVPDGRRLVVFLIDATWHCSRTIARENPALMRLPRLAINPGAPSRFVIRRQPAGWCLSTIEAVHELLVALEAGGLDVYPDRHRLIKTFHAMQDFQILQTAIARKRQGTSSAVRGARLPQVVHSQP
jgi:DTW domain-containing protein YfiP